MLALSKNVARVMSVQEMIFYLIFKLCINIDSETPRIFVSCIMFVTEESFLFIIFIYVYEISDLNTKKQMKNKTKL